MERRICPQPLAALVKAALLASPRYPQFKEVLGWRRGRPVCRLCAETQILGGVPAGGHDHRAALSRQCVRARAQGLAGDLEHQGHLARLESLPPRPERARRLRVR
jgi:hypothetical protein